MTGEDPDADEVTLDEHLHSASSQSSEWDPKPTLLYFHHNHDIDEDEGEKLSPAGKASLQQCKSLDDEKVARWSQLYRFVEVDVPSSERELLDRFKAGDGPSFTVVDQDLKVMASSGSLGSSKAVVSFLSTTLKKRFPEYWSTVQVRLDEQKKALKDARSLEKAKKFDEALDRVREITGSNLRIGKQYDDAVKLGSSLQKKLD